jgi:hypothetical protein
MSTLVSCRAPQELSKKQLPSFVRKTSAQSANLLADKALVVF